MDSEVYMYYLSVSRNVVEITKTNTNTWAVILMIVFAVLLVAGGIAFIVCHLKNKKINELWRKKLQDERESNIRILHNMEAEKYDLIKKNHQERESLIKKMNEEKTLFSQRIREEIENSIVDEATLSNKTERELLIDSVKIISSYGKRLDLIELKLKSVDEFQTSYASLNQKLNAMRTSADDLNKLIKTVNETSNRYNSTTMQLNNEVAELNQQVKNLHDISPKINSITQNVDESMDILESTSAKLRELTYRMNEIMEDIQNKSKGIIEKNLEHTCSIQHKLVTECDDSYTNSLASRLVAILRELSDLSSDVSSIRYDVSNIESDVSNLRSNMSNIECGINNLSSMVND